MIFVLSAVSPGRTVDSLLSVANLLLTFFSCEIEKMPNAINHIFKVTCELGPLKCPYHLLLTPIILTHDIVIWLRFWNLEEWFYFGEAASSLSCLPSYLHLRAALSQFPFTETMQSATWRRSDSKRKASIGWGTIFTSELMAQEPTISPKVKTLSLFRFWTKTTQHQHPHPHGSSKPTSQTPPPPQWNFAWHEVRVLVYMCVCVWCRKRSHTHTHTHTHTCSCSTTPAHTHIHTNTHILSRVCVTVIANTKLRESVTKLFARRVTVTHTQKKTKFKERKKTVCRRFWLLVTVTKFLFPGIISF